MTPRHVLSMAAWLSKELRLPYEKALTVATHQELALRAAGFDIIERKANDT